MAEDEAGILTRILAKTPGGDYVVIVHTEVPAHEHTAGSGGGALLAGPLKRQRKLPFLCHEMAISQPGKR